MPTSRDRGDDSNGRMPRRRLPGHLLIAPAPLLSWLITLLTRSRSQHAALLEWYVDALRTINDQVERGELPEAIANFLVRTHWDTGRATEEDLFAFAGGGRRRRPSRATRLMVDYLVALEFTLARMRRAPGRPGGGAVAAKSVILTLNYDALLGDAIAELRRRPTPRRKARWARALTDSLVSQLASLLSRRKREAMTGDLMEDLADYRSKGWPEWRLWLHVLWQARGWGHVLIWGAVGYLLGWLRYFFD
jgi:hypothetical protein